jgi:D-aminopeptidase
MNVGIVADGVAEYMMSLNPDIAVTTSTANALVTECSDAYLNDMQGRHVRQQHVREAIGRASVGPVAEGTVGAGTGMSLYGFKGGIGTASRRLPAELGGYTVGAIVLGNFGRRDQLTIAGVPVGRALADWQPDDSMKDTGSCIVLLATDAPMLDRALRRLARRAALGLARTGSIAGNSSGDFIVAFSNALRLPHDSDELLVSLQHITESGRLIDALFQASVEATEEAVINALFRATTLDGWDGHIRHALPLDRTLELLGQAGVLRAS